MELDSVPAHQAVTLTLPLATLPWGGKNIYSNFLRHRVNTLFLRMGVCVMLLLLPLFWGRGEGRGGGQVHGASQEKYRPLPLLLFALANLYNSH